MSKLNYFPPSSLSDYRAKLFGEALQELEELPLFPVSETHRYSSEFRLLLEPSFRPNYLIRVRAIGTTWWIVYKWKEQFVLTAPTYSKNEDVVQSLSNHKVLHRAERILSSSEARTLESLIDQLEFFSLPVDYERIGTDGETWLLEGVINNEYHVVCRWCPNSAELVNFGNYLLKLSQKTQNTSSSGTQDSVFDAFQESLQKEEIKQAFEFQQLLRSNSSNRRSNLLEDIANILRTPKHFDQVLQLVQNAQWENVDLTQLAIVVAERCEENQAMALVDILRSKISQIDDRYNSFHSQTVGATIGKILAIRICRTRNVLRIFSLTNQSFQIAQTSKSLTRSRVVAGIFQEIDLHKLSKHREILVWFAILCCEVKYRFGRSKLSNLGLVVD